MRSNVIWVVAFLGLASVPAGRLAAEDYSAWYSCMMGCAAMAHENTNFHAGSCLSTCGRPPEPVYGHPTPPPSQPPSDPPIAHPPHHPPAPPPGPCLPTAHGCIDHPHPAPVVVIRPSGSAAVPGARSEIREVIRRNGMGHIDGMQVTDDMLYYRGR